MAPSASSHLLPPGWEQGGEGLKGINALAPATRAKCLWQRLNRQSEEIRAD